MLKFIFWNDLSEIYPNVAAYKILVIITLTVASAERSLSKKKSITI